MKKLNTRFLLILGSVTLLLAAGTAVAHQLQASRLGQALLWQADKAEKENRLDQAAKHLARYLEFQPEDTEQRARLGKLLASSNLPGTSKNHERALFTLEQVLAREPARNELRPLVVKLALELKRWKVAEEHLQILRKATPESGKVAALMAQWHEAQNELVEAEAWYGKAAKWSPGDENSYLRQAELLQKRLRKGKATTRLRPVEEIYDALIANNPKSVQAYLARSRYRQKCGAVAEAIQDLKTARELAPDDVDVLLASAAFAEGLKQFDQAREELQRGLKLYPTEVRLYEAIAWLEIQAGQRGTGLDYVRRALQTAAGETRKELLWSFANLLLDGRDVAEAETVMAQMRKANVNTAALSYLQGRVLVCKSKWSEAARLLERTRPLLETSPQVTRQLDLFLGQCFEELNDPAQQLIVYNRVLAYDPDCVQARRGAAAALNALGRTADALAEYKQLAAQPNAPPAARIDLARLLILDQLQSEDKDWQKVDKALREAEEAQPNAADVVLLRVEALAAQNQFDAASQVLAKARERDPERVDYRVALAGLALRQGNSAQAAALLEETEKQTGDTLLLRLGKANYLATLPRAEAEPGLEKLASGLEKFSAEERSRLLGTLADAWLRLGDLRRAESIWAALAKEPRHANDLNLRLLLFDLRLRNDDDDGMLRLTQEIHRIEGQQGPLTRYTQAARILWRAARGKKADLDEARLHLDYVATQRPNWPIVQLARAEVEILKGNDEQAIADFRRAIELGERSPRVIRKLVELLYRKQRYAEADQEIRRLQKQTLIAADLQRLAADLSLRNQDPTRAVELATEAVAKDSRDYRDRLWLGLVLAASGKQPARAEAELRKAVELAPKAPETWVALVRFLVLADQRGEADKVLADALVRLPKEKLHLAAGQCQEALGNNDMAHKEYQQALLTQPGDFNTLRSVATFYLRTARYSDAQPLLQQMLGAKPRLPESETMWARQNLALVLAATGDYQQFLKALSMVDLAIDKSGMVVETATNEPTPAELRARAHVLAQQPQRPHRKKAIALLETLQRGQWLNFEDQFLLARLYNAENNWPKARALLRDLVTTAYRSPLYLMAYGEGLIAHREFADAAQCIEKLDQLEKLNKTEPGNYGTVQLRALALEANGQPDKAVALIRDHVGRPGAKPDEFMVLVRYLEKQKKIDEALEVCGRALEQCPVEQVTAAAVVVLRSGKASEEQCAQVERWISSALTKNPKSVVLKLYLADLQEIRGRYEEVVAIYRAVLDQEPMNVAALNNQAWLLAQLNDKTADALAMINRAIELMGPQPALLDTRAVVQMKLGRADLAIGDLERVTAEAPSAARWFHLACALQQSNNDDAARRAFRRARDMGLLETQLHPLERASWGRVYAELEKE
jgi:tetratricopeptide (TPR) repeat protein